MPTKLLLLTANHKLQESVWQELFLVGVGALSKIETEDSSTNRPSTKTNTKIRMERGINVVDGTQPP